LSVREQAESGISDAISIPVPEGGLGKQLTEMIDWRGRCFADWTFHGLIDENQRDERGS
jgi:hypothetical protein